MFIMTTTVVPESRVLRPRDPAITDSDDWPEFTLHDASVSLPDTDRNDYVSLLLAHVNFPVRVTGRLQAPGEDQAHLWRSPPPQAAPAAGKRPPPSYVDIELTDVRSFAYGAYPDGGVEIWAAGNAGWFVLRPSTSYQRFYDDMVEAVNVLYFIVDAYSSSKKTKPPTARQLFNQYSREIDGDANDAAARIHKHRDFLLCSMMTNREGLEWSTVPLYMHLMDKFPRDVYRVKSRLDGADIKAKGRGPKGAALTSGTGSTKRKRTTAENATAETILVASQAEEGFTGRERPGRTSSRNKKVGSARASPMSMTETPRESQNRWRNTFANSNSGTPEVPDTFSTPTPDSESDMAALQSKTKSALRLKPHKPTKGIPSGPSKGTKSRSREEIEIKDDPDEFSHNPRHRTKRRHSGDVDEGIDMPSSPSSTTTTNDALLSSSSVPAVPDPLQVATWTCALDGCAHKVYPSADAQALIREHYALHAYDDDQRVQLVRTLQAPSMPVEHLLERVKMQARADGFPTATVAGTRFPQPLRVRY